MLAKHKKVFSGPEKRLGKVSDKFDMDIDADAKAIRPQQPYRTSPRKRKLIREVVDQLEKMGVVQLSNSEIASPVVM
jgi:hypothetical protein